MNGGRNEGGAMLASLLPGIRDLRTPLATGYVWLLTFWLWLPERLKIPAPGSAFAHITEIAHYAGRIGVGVAVSFIAYLIGALSESLNTPFARLGVFMAAFGEQRITLKEYRSYLRRFVYNLRLRIRRVPELVNVASLPRRDRSPGYWARHMQFKGEYGLVGVNNILAFAKEAALQGRIRPDARNEYATYVLKEALKQGNSLIGKEPELFSVYDRLISEYEFRVSITVPLTALIITLAFQSSLLWLLILPMLLILLATGIDRRVRAGDLLAEAVRWGRLVIAPPQELAPDVGKA